LNVEHGKTVVMVTHDPHAANFAKTVRYLDKGKLLPSDRVPEDWLQTTQPNSGSRSASLGSLRPDPRTAL
jgi:ABC-type lipoprotein export system ATPase subunit